MIFTPFGRFGSPVATPPAPLLVLEIDAKQILRLIFDVQDGALRVNHAGKGSPPVPGDVTELDAAQILKEVFNKDLVKLKVVS